MIKHISIFIISILLLGFVFKSGQKYGEKLIKDEMDKQISKIEKQAIIQSNKDKVELKTRYEKQIAEYNKIASQLENCMNSKLDKELLKILGTMK